MTGLAVGHGRNAAAAAEVGNDRRAQIGDGVHDRLHGNPMEAVAPHAHGCHFVGYRKARASSGKPLWKAVSKQATCGTCGQVARASSMVSIAPADGAGPAG